MHVNELPNEGRYLIWLVPDCGTIPMASGDKIKKLWEQKLVRHLTTADKVPPGYGLVQCSDTVWIAVKPYGDTPALETRFKGRSQELSLDLDTSRKSVGIVEVPVPVRTGQAQNKKKKPDPPKVEQVVIEDQSEKV